MRTQLLDLSYPISETGSRYPTDPAPKVTVVPARVEEGRLNSGYTELVIRNHHGTHIDAPAHKIPGGKTIDQYPLDKFINRAVLVDLTPHLGPGERCVQRISQERVKQVLTPQRLREMRQEGISAVLFRTGYGEIIESGVTDDYGFPYFETGAAEYVARACTEQGIGLNVIGLDSFSVDPKGTPDSPVHQILLAHDTVILETLVHLDRVGAAFADGVFELICVPVLYAGADAAQTRAFARALGLRLGGGA
jgi:kynurenine formamidase